MLHILGIDGITYNLRDDLTGRRFGRLVVYRLSGKDVSGHSCWVCTCDCGSSLTVVGTSLNRGITSSCGCLQSERLSERNTKHGLSSHQLYHTAAGIQQRTCNPENPDYRFYGAVGRNLFNEWKGAAGLVNLITFLEFLPVPHGYLKYDDRLSIDRIDNDVGYFPDNLRWATRKEQARNMKIRKDNTSGVVGVYSDKHNTKWTASWVDASGVSKSKSFSTKKHGAEKALLLAIEARCFAEKDNQFGVCGGN